MNKIQDKNAIILDESVTFYHPTSKLHNDIDTTLSRNTITPAKKPESDKSTVKIKELITSYLNHRKDEHLESLQDKKYFLKSYF